MADPIPYVVAEGGSAGAAPDGAIPIALFGAGGGGGGSVDSVNGQVGDVELVIEDIPELQDTLDSKAIASEVADLATTIQGTLTTMNADIASRASAEDLDNVNVKADDALFMANAAVKTADVAGLRQTGWLRGHVRDADDPSPTGLPDFTLVVRLEE